MIQWLQQPFRRKLDHHSHPVATDYCDAQVPAWKRLRIAHLKPYVFGVPEATRPPAEQAQRISGGERVVLSRSDFLLAGPCLLEGRMVCVDIEGVSSRRCIVLGSLNEPDEELAEGPCPGNRIDEG